MPQVVSKLSHDLARRTEMAMSLVLTIRQRSNLKRIGLTLNMYA